MMGINIINREDLNLVQHAFLWPMAELRAADTTEHVEILQ